MIKLGEMGVILHECTSHPSNKNLDLYRFVASSSQMIWSNRFGVFKDKYGIKSTIVEVPIPNHDAIDNLRGFGILIKLTVNFDEAETR